MNLLILAARHKTTIALEKIASPYGVSFAKKVVEIPGAAQTLYKDTKRMAKLAIRAGNCDRPATSVHFQAPAELEYRTSQAGHDYSF